MTSVMSIFYVLLFCASALSASSSSSTSNSLRCGLSPISNFPVPLQGRLAQIRAFSDTLMNSEECSGAQNSSYAGLLRGFYEFCAAERVDPYSMLCLKYPEWNGLALTYLEDVPDYINSVEKMGLLQFLDTMMETTEPESVFFFVNLFAPDYFDKRMVRYGAGLIKDPVDLADLNLHDFVLKTGVYEHLDNPVYQKLFNYIVSETEAIALLLQACIDYRHNELLISETRAFLFNYESIFIHTLNFCEKLQVPEHYQTVLNVYPLSGLHLNKKVIKKDDRCRRLVLSSIKSINEFDAFMKFLPVQEGSEEWQQFYKLFLQTHVQQ